MRYRSIFEESRDAIYISTREGRFVDVNKAALQLFGYSKEDMLNMNVQMIYFDPVDRKKFQAKIKENGSVKDFEIKMRKKDGTVMTCLVTASTWHEDKLNQGYQGIIHDITETLKMQEELQKNNKLESLGILAGGIAHDFNNILTAIIGDISMAKVYAKQDDKIFFCLNNAEKATRLAKDLTKQLLTFSKGGAPVKETIPIKELLKESTGFALRGSNVHCEFDIYPDLFMANVDPGQIAQVINNLAINADQAMPEGGKLKLSAINSEIEEDQLPPLKAGEYIKITMEDNGCGIPANLIKDIFYPFFTTKKKGNGLGLAIALSIMLKHSGYITVQSTEKIGTTIDVYIPASYKNVCPTSHKNKKTNYFANKEPIRKGSGKILLMDDEEIIRDVSGRMLNHIGYKVKFAKDGQEAIECYEKAITSSEPFDAVIMDLTIPGGMGGKEAILILKDIDHDVKAIVSSGYANDPALSNFRDHGFSGCISKPYKLQDLIDALQKTLGSTTKNEV